jgi:putative nucleotidyltransferase with HDIG domain|tara:strand:- start:105 stop:632 length:528 start_codon:yes stop_codon:yes gene_type:complete
MRVPTREECFEILKEYRLPQRIIDHTLMVNKVAMLLAKKLVERGIQINLDLLDSASLLHDLDKIITLKDGDNHGKISAKILIERGYPELAKLVKVHKSECLADDLIQTWEEKLLLYADCRSQWDKIVDLKTRFQYGRDNYPHLNDIKYKDIEKKGHEIEKEIFQYIDFEPEELKI